MARKTECLAMLLAGGQGSRLGILTKNIAKPAVPYGGKYRIIDFPLSNCVNSGISTVGVLTQYQPLELNDYIGNGQEAQAGMKIAGRNINNLRYADDTTLMVESEEELKSLLMKVKEAF